MVSPVHTCWPPTFSAGRRLVEKICGSSHVGTETRRELAGWNPITPSLNPGFLSLPLAAIWGRESDTGTSQHVQKGGPRTGPPNLWHQTTHFSRFLVWRHRISADDVTFLNYCIIEHIKKKFWMNFPFKACNKTLYLLCFIYIKKLSSCFFLLSISFFFFFICTAAGNRSQQEGLWFESQAGVF